MLLLDSITRADVFKEAARQARRRSVPVLVYKFGRSPRGRHAAELHSSRVAGGARAFSAWLRALGVAEAADFESAMFAATLLGAGHHGGRGLGASSTSGAGAAMMADLAEVWGVDLPAFDDETRNLLAELHAFSEPSNPLDLAGLANDREWLAATMDTVFQDNPGFDTVVLLSTLLPSKERGVAPVVSEFAMAAARHPKSSCVHAVGPLADEYRADLTDAGTPIADNAATLFGALDTLQRMQGLTASYPVRDQAATSDHVLSGPDVPGGGLVLHDEVRASLVPLGVSFVPERTAQSVAEAADLFEGLGGRSVAMKLLDRNLPHTASAGGLALGISDAERARTTAQRLLTLATSLDARVLLQSMTGCAVEIFAGTVFDPVAGPVVVVGRGGSDVERDPDVRVELAPVDQDRAVELLREVRPVMDGLRAAARMAGRDVEDCLADVAAIVVTVSELAFVNRDYISSIDLNPLVVGEDGRPAALDARIQLAT